MFVNLICQNCYDITSTGTGMKLTINFYLLHGKTILKPNRYKTAFHLILTYD